MPCSRVSSSVKLVFDCLSQTSWTERSAPLTKLPQRIAMISNSKLLVICLLPIPTSAISLLEIALPPTSATIAHPMTLVPLTNSLYSEHSVRCALISLSVLFDFLQHSMTLHSSSTTLTNSLWNSPSSLISCSSLISNSAISPTCHPLPMSSLFADPFLPWTRHRGHSA